MSDYRVVFHIDECTKWKLTLANAQNILNDLGEAIDVVVLANAKAVKGLVKSSPYEENIQTLILAGVQFRVCQNALRSYKVANEDLIAQVEVVPAEVSELVKLQYQDYAYIKP